jgi:glucose-6-phosphate 1-epimerase
MADLSHSVVLSSEHENFPIFEIDHPKCKARIALHGAHVLSWHPVGAEEVLYLSPESHFREGKAIRGGIPLCWPWFSAHASDLTLPSHGFARIRFWELLSVSETQEAVTFRFATKWRDLSAIAEIICGNMLEVKLTTINEGEGIAEVGGALHSYFRISNISNVAVNGLEDYHYLDTLAPQQPKRQVEAIHITEEFDAIYPSDAVVKIIDTPMDRVIVIEKNACPSTVVWNPWVAKARSLSDLPDEAYREFVCVEPAIVNTEMVSLAPGDHFTFSTTIRLEAHAK